MKTIILTLLMASGLQCLAQSKFSVGLNSSIDMCRLSNVSGNDQGIANLYNQPGLGYQVGTRFKFDITNVFSLITGVTHVSHQLRSEEIKLKPLASDPFVPESIQENKTLKYFQIPLLGSFYFGSQWKVGFTLGAAYNYIYRIDELAYGYWPSKTKEYKSTMKLSSGNQFLSAIAGIGAEYNSKVLTIRIEPTVNYQMYYFNDETMDNDRLWSAGLLMSGYYKF